MIKEIIDLLQHDTWNVKSDVIDIAKGKNHLPKNIKQLKNKIKRQWESRK